MRTSTCSVGVQASPRKKNNNNNNKKKFGLFLVPSPASLGAGSHGIHSMGKSSFHMVPTPWVISRPSGESSYQGSSSGVKSSPDSKTHALIITLLSNYI